MSEPKYSGTGADWTQLLTDPALVSRLGELLQVYREAAPEKREALVEAIRNIKGSTAKIPVAPPAPASPPVAQAGPVVPPAPVSPVATSPAASPPFEPDTFTSASQDNRRRHTRIKCFVPVELRLSNSAVPIWGNLANTSLGGCFVRQRRYPQE